MNLALLGEDPLTLPLLDAIAGDGDSDLVIATEVDGLAPQLMQRFPGLRITEAESLLSQTHLDAVLVTGHNEAVLEAAKKIAATGVPLIILPDAAQGLTWIYEISLIRDDCDVTLLPVFPAEHHLDVITLLEDSAAGKLGPLKHLTCDREQLVENGFTPQDVQSALLHDAGLLRRLAGEFNRVTALHTGVTEDAMNSATVTLAGDEIADAAWTLKPAPQPNWRLTIQAELGNRELHQQTTADQRQVGDSMLAHIKEGLTRSSGEEWTHLVRTFEIVDAERRSVKRRRTIDLHFETTSERNLFKSQMTAIGCGVLTLTFFAVVGLLIAGAVLDRRPAVEVNADAADAILYQTEFKADSPELTKDGSEHLATIATRMRSESFQLLIEQAEPANEVLDEQRETHVTNTLNTQGIPAEEAARRTETAKLAGPWFKTAMTIARVIVFLPLFLFLGLQFLLVLTRPAAGDSP